MLQFLLLDQGQAEPASVAAAPNEFSQWLGAVVLWRMEVAAA
jgi:hypothetical protein